MSCIHGGECLMNNRALVGAQSILTLFGNFEGAADGFVLNEPFGHLQCFSALSVHHHVDGFKTV